MENNKPRIYVDEIHEKHILSNPEGGDDSNTLLCVDHPGNVIYYSRIQDKVDKFYNAKSKKIEAAIVKSIYDELFSKNRKKTGEDGYQILTFDPVVQKWWYYDDEDEVIRQRQLLVRRSLTESSRTYVDVLSPTKDILCDQNYERNWPAHGVYELRLRARVEDYRIALTKEAKSGIVRELYDGFVDRKDPKNCFRFIGYDKESYGYYIKSPKKCTEKIQGRLNRMATESPPVAAQPQVAQPPPCEEHHGNNFNVINNNDIIKHDRMVHHRDNHGNDFNVIKNNGVIEHDRMVHHRDIHDTATYIPNNHDSPYDNVDAQIIKNIILPVDQLQPPFQEHHDNFPEPDEYSTNDGGNEQDDDDFFLWLMFGDDTHSVSQAPTRMEQLPLASTPDEEPPAANVPMSSLVAAAAAAFVPSGNNKRSPVLEEYKVYPKKQRDNDDEQRNPYRPDESNAASGDNISNTNGNDISKYCFLCLEPTGSCNDDCRILQRLFIES